MVAVDIYLNETTRHADVILSLSPAALLTGLLLTGRKTTMLQLRAHPEGVDLGPLQPTMPARLQTKNKRIDLAPALIVADLDRLHSSLDAGSQLAADELLLIGRRHKQDCNSWMHNTPRLTKGRPRTRLGHASTVAGVSINDLTDPERLDVSGNAALNGVPVRVTAVDSPSRLI